MARTLWQDIYMVQKTTGIKHWPRFTSNDVGVGGGGGATAVFALPLTSHPHLPPFSVTQENELTIGKAERYFLEYNQTVGEPSSFTLEALTNTYLESLLFMAAVDDSHLTIAESGGIETLTLDSSNIATDAVKSQNYLSFVRVLDSSSSTPRNSYLSHCVVGVVPSSITISGSEGGLITTSAEMMCSNWYPFNMLGEIKNDPRLNYGPIATGSTCQVRAYNWATQAFTEIDANWTIVDGDGDFTDPDSLGAGTVEVSRNTGNLNFSSSDLSTYSGQWINCNNYSGNSSSSWSTLTTFLSKTPLKYQNTIMTLGGSAVDVNEFSVTFNFNHSLHFYNNPQIIRILLGRVTCEGSITIPRSSTNYGDNSAFTDFINGTDSILSMYWGSSTATADKSMAIDLNIRYTDTDIGGDNELGNILNFAGVADSSGNSSFVVKLGHATATQDLELTTTSTSTTSTSTSTTTTTTT